MDERSNVQNALGGGRDRISWLLVVIGVVRIRIEQAAQEVLEVAWRATTTILNQAIDWWWQR